MKISDLLQAVKSEILIPDAGLVSEVLLSFVLNKSKEKLFINSEENIDEKDVERFKELIQRHLNGEPVAYLVNHKQFYGLDFYVDKNVLIPRPETEMLVDKVLEFTKNAEIDRVGLFSVLDVGTGCGNIAISIAKNSEDVHLTAVDISSAAIEVAKKNAVINGLVSKIDFMISDLMTNLEGEYDVIVANLPYIGVERFNLVSKEAYDFEPHVALFGGQDGLLLYEKLFDQINDRVVSAGAKMPALIIGEFGFLQGDVMRELINNKFPNSKLIIEKDLASIERIFMIKSC